LSSCMYQCTDTILKLTKFLKIEIANIFLLFKKTEPNLKYIGTLIELAPKLTYQLAARKTKPSSMLTYELTLITFLCKSD